jgi:hypothetical protein
MMSYTFNMLKKQQFSEILFNFCSQALASYQHHGSLIGVKQ